MARGLARYAFCARCELVFGTECTAAVYVMGNLMIGKMSVEYSVTSERSKDADTAFDEYLGA